MSTASKVWVYVVDDRGATGAPVGTGALVTPRAVVVRAPLSTALAARGGAPPRLRVGIATAASDLVEVLDPADVKVFKLEEDLVVALVLSAPAQSTPDRVAGLEHAQDERGAARAVRAHLAGRTDPDVSALSGGEASQGTVVLPDDEGERPDEVEYPDEGNHRRQDNVRGNFFCMLFGHGRWCARTEVPSGEPAPVAT